MGQNAQKAVQSSKSSVAFHLETVKKESQQWHYTAQADYGLDNYMSSTKWGDLQDLNSPKPKIQNYGRNGPQ